QEQAFQIPTKSFSLIPLLKEAVKWPDILFKRLWSSCCLFSFTHELFPPFSLALILSPLSTNYRYADLQANNVRCWYAPEDLKIGDKFRVRIDESIRLYDKL